MKFKRGYQVRKMLTSFILSLVRLIKKIKGYVPEVIPEFTQNYILLETQEISESNLIPSSLFLKIPFYYHHIEKPKERKSTNTKN